MNWIRAIKDRPRLMAALAATLAGFLAAVLAYQWTEQQRVFWQDLAKPKGGTAEVLVFSRQLEAGDLLSEQTLSVRTVQKSLLPDGTLSPDRFNEIAGRRIAARVNKGEVLLTQQIATAQSQDSLAQARPGYRLVSVDRAGAQMAWSAMTPRDRIDVWAVGASPEDLASVGSMNAGIQREPVSTAIASARRIAVGLRVLSSSDQSTNQLSNTGGSPSAPIAYFLELPEAAVASYLAAVASSQVRFVLNINGQNSQAPSASAPKPIEILIHEEGVKG